MPPRSAPTGRQRRLGSELRKLRENAGLSTVEAARRLNVGQSRISAIEAGRYGVSGERVRTFARAYGCDDLALVDALADMTKGRRRHWWDEYRDILPAGLLDLAELEHHAHAIRTAQVSHLPGLLQTVDYARAVFRQNVPELSLSMLEHRTSHRIKRQHVILETGTSYTATVHEAALHMRFGGLETTRRQLVHMAETSERPNITLRIIPFSTDDCPGSGQSVLYAEGPVPSLDTVQLDSEHGSELLHSSIQLSNYRTFLRRFEEAGLASASARDIIHRVLKTM
ncbi:transcriptional regulator WhiJ [Streptomyces sodiiphilus]|uniref:Transcriptional regulator WhiJ n=1 Tax=Streptomyces sodiiphilus TaxID=226217 RepID=A0ABN2PV35_9ACTN